MWDVFSDDMGLDNSVELALANMDLNDPVLELVTFDDGDPLEGSFSTPVDANPGMGKEAEEEDDEEESSGDFVDSCMEDYLHMRFFRLDLPLFVFSSGIPTSM